MGCYGPYVVHVSTAERLGLSQRLDSSKRKQKGDKHVEYKKYKQPGFRRSGFSLCLSSSVLETKERSVTPSSSFKKLKDSLAWVALQL